MSHFYLRSNNSLYFVNTSSNQVSKTSKIIKIIINKQQALNVIYRYQFRNFTIQTVVLANFLL